MSIKVMARAWEKSQQRGSYLLTVLALADLSNDDGWCWPSVEHLASKVRVKPRQMFNILQKLSAAKEVVVYSNMGPLYAERQPAYATNLYWLAVGVQSFAPPPDVLGILVMEPPIYGGDENEGGICRGAILRREIAGNPSLTLDSLKRRDRYLRGLDST